MARAAPDGNTMLPVVVSKLGISSLKELIAKAKQEPAMTYGSTGPGTTTRKLTFEPYFTGRNFLL